MSFEFVLWAAVLLAASQFLVSRLPERRVRPAAGVAVCLAVLSLRVVLSLAFVLFVLQYTSTGAHFAWLPAWCAHLAAPMPLLHSHPGLGEHALGDILRLVPAGVVAISALLSAIRVSAEHREVARWIKNSSIGEGPSGSVIVRHPEMMLAVAGVRRPKILVSPAALISLDDAELAAGLQHELGHIERWHQIVSAVGVVLFGFSRAVPGGQRTLARLRYYLERDADEFAVGRTEDPTSLARAICKISASKEGGQGFAMAGLRGSGVPERLNHLVERRSSSAGLDLLLIVSTLAIAALAIALLTIGAELLMTGNISPPHVSLASQICN